VGFVDPAAGLGEEGEGFAQRGSSDQLVERGDARGQGWRRVRGAAFRIERAQHLSLQCIVRGKRELSSKKPDVGR